jgi:hypothetical protein
MLSELSVWLQRYSRICLPHDDGDDACRTFHLQAPYWIVIEPEVCHPEIE